MMVQDAFGAMRLFAVPLLVALSTSVAGVAGVVVGIGTGTLYALDQSWSCAEIPFHVDALYLPGDAGALHFRYGLAAGSLSCPFLSGGGAIIGSLRYDLAAPSAEFEFNCTGSEEVGLYCEGQTQDGTIGQGGIGPHEFLGTTWVWFQGADFVFLGEFMAP